MDSEIKNVLLSDIIFQKAKAKLNTVKHAEDTTLYDHLLDIIKRLLKSEQKYEPNEIDHLHRLSQFSRIMQKQIVRETELTSAEYELAKQKLALIEIKSINKIETECILPNMFYLGNLFRQASIGISEDECVMIYFKLQKLSSDYPNQKFRFWGKIFGTFRNYWIIEGDNFTKWPVLSSDENTTKSEHVVDTNETVSPLKLNDDVFDVNDLPKSLWKPPQVVPLENQGDGANKNAYFVCNGIESELTLLPLVEPAQIKCARQIRHFFTGKLDADIVSLPPFPGKEKHLLRAQIARISASTIISPIDYYQFNEDEENLEEDESPRFGFVENSEYEPPTLLELADSSLTNWVHNMSALLPQGRTKWVEVKRLKDEASTHHSDDSDLESKDDEDYDEDDDVDEEEPEIGPPLLRPISEDENINGIPPWSVYISSNQLPDHAMAVVTSNWWPGAYAIAQGRMFENVYIGWGQKYLDDSFKPIVHPPVMVEFEVGPEVMEMEDPTAEEESAWQAAQAELEAGGELDDDPDLNNESENTNDDDDDDEEDDDDDDEY